jgi:hypothetical protein
MFSLLHSCITAWHQYALRVVAAISLVKYFCKHIFNGSCIGLLQIGDAADAKAQAAEARQEELLTKEFASKTRVEEHRSESHQESKDGQVTKKTEKRSDKKSESHSNQAAEGAGVGEHE